MKKNPVFQLRGACTADNGLDWKYKLLLDDPKPGEMVFEGFTGLSRLVYTDNGRWQMMFFSKNLKEPLQVGADISDSKFLFGTVEWSFSERKKCLADSRVKFGKVNCQHQY